MKYFRQCTFRKGPTTQTAWIEERGALLGRKIELKSEREGDQRDWEVVAVGGRASQEMVEELARDHKDQRKASDI